MILFRHCDPRFPFLWDGADQPAARWHDEGDGPVQYLSDSPDTAWAEFVRHEEIRDPADLVGVRRSLWGVEVEALPDARPRLANDLLIGGRGTYAACREEARRLRRQGASGLVAPSAAIAPGGAHGWHVRGGTTVAARARDGLTIALFGSQPELVGWCAAYEGRPEDRLLERVRKL